MPEKRYRHYGKKLIRHSQTKPYNLLRLAQFEASQLDINWFRFSVSGSAPRKSSLTQLEWNKTKAAIRDLCSELVSRGVKIHFPVESIEKARSYRTALKGLPVVVRRTIQDKRNLFNFQDHCAYVVGEKSGKRNIETAFKLAKFLRESGKGVVVCPAIKGVSKTPSKCGKCTACSNEFVDIVLYPKHK